MLLSQRTLESAHSSSETLHAFLGLTSGWGLKQWEHWLYFYFYILLYLFDSFNCIFVTSSDFSRFFFFHQIMKANHGMQNSVTSRSPSPVK